MNPVPTNPISTPVPATSGLDWTGLYSFGSLQLTIATAAPRRFDTVDTKFYSRPRPSIPNTIQRDDLER